MPLKRVTIDQGKQPLELLGVVGVLGKNVFAQGIADRAVNEREGAFAMRSRQFAEKLPALGHLLRVAIGHFQLIASPKNSPLSAARKSFAIVQRPFTVFAQNRRSEAQHP